MMSEYDLFTPDPEAVKAWVEKHLMPKQKPVLVWRGRHPDVARGADGKMFTAIEANIQAEHHDKPKASETVTALVLEQRAKDLRKDIPVQSIFTEIKVGMKVYQPEWSRSYEVKSIDPDRKTITLHTYGGAQAIYFWHDLQNLAIAP